MKNVFCTSADLYGASSEEGVDWGGEVGQLVLIGHHRPVQGNEDVSKEMKAQR